MFHFEINFMILIKKLEKLFNPVDEPLVKFTAAVGFRPLQRSGAGLMHRLLVSLPMGGSIHCVVVEDVHYFRISLSVDINCFIPSVAVVLK